MSLTFHGFSNDDDICWWCNPNHRLYSNASAAMENNNSKHSHLMLFSIVPSWTDRESCQNQHVHQNFEYSKHSFKWTLISDMQSKHNNDDKTKIFLLFIYKILIDITSSFYVYKSINITLLCQHNTEHWIYTKYRQTCCKQTKCLWMNSIIDYVMAMYRLKCV